LNVNKQMVRTGHAWVYKRYMKDKTLITDEDYAKSKKIGIWALAEHLRVAPWIWRKEGN